MPHPVLHLYDSIDFRLPRPHFIVVENCSGYATVKISDANFFQQNDEERTIMHIHVWLFLGLLPTTNTRPFRSFLLRTPIDFSIHLSNWRVATALKRFFIIHLIAVLYVCSHELRCKNLQTSFLCIFIFTRSSATAEKQRVSCPHGGG